MQEEIYWVMNMFVCFFANQNTFKVTVLSFPLIHFVFFVLQLQVQYFDYFCPYNGEKLAYADSIGITIQRMVIFIGAELLIIYNNYLAQRDLITQVIKTHLIKQ